MKKNDLFRRLMILLFCLTLCACRNAKMSGSYSPATAYDPINGRYLVLFLKFKTKYYLDAESRISGRFVDSGGSLLGTEFVISEGSSYYWPSVVFDSTHMKYLVIWNSEDNIYGQLVNSDGSLSGTRLIMSNTATAPCGARCSAVAYDDTAQKFVAVWGEQNASSHDSVYAQLINSDGSLYGPKLSVSDDGALQTFPSIAYDGISQRFFVVWEGADNRQIKGRMINPDGTFIAAEFPISSTTGTHYVPTVTYNSVDARFLVSWEHTLDNNTYDLLGQQLNADGSLYQSVIRISSPARNAFWHASIYNPSDNNYLLLFGDRSQKVVYTQIVKSDGTLDTTISEDNILISYAGYPHDSRPSAAFDSINKRFFSSWEYGLTDFQEEFPDVHGRLLNADGSPAGDISVVSNGGVW